MLSLGDNLLEEIAMARPIPAPQGGKEEPSRKGKAAQERITHRNHPKFKETPEVRETEEVRVDIQGMIDDVLQGKPFEIEAADAFQSGETLLRQLRPASISGVIVEIESGRKEKATLEMPLLEQDIYGVTLPGVKAKNGKYPTNQDGMVMAYDSTEQSLTAGIIHNTTDSEESAAVTNVETVSAAYDLSKLRSPALTEMFFRMNNRSAPLEKEVGNSFPHGVLMRMQPMENRGLLDVEVVTNGFFRCMVIDPSGTFVSSQPIDDSGDKDFLPLLYNQPIGKVLDVMEDSISNEKDKMLIQGLRTRLESKKFSEEQIRQFLRNLMLEPRTQKLEAAPGEVVVMVPEVIVQEFGGDEAFAKYFSTLAYQEGQSLKNVCKAIVNTLENTMNGTESSEGTVDLSDILEEVYPKEHTTLKGAVSKEPLLEQSLSVIAFQVPEVPEK